MITVYDGFITMVAGPIFGAIFTTITIGVLVLLGLPLRLVRPLNIFWRRNWWIAPCLAALAILMMALSYLPSLRIELYNPETQQNFQSFHPTLSIGGWLLMLFSILHTYPPFLFASPTHFEEPRRDARIQ